MFFKRTISQHLKLSAAASLLLLAATFTFVMLSTRSTQAQPATVQPSAPVIAAIDPSIEYAPDIVIVKLKPNVSLTPKSGTTAARDAVSTNNAGLEQAMQAIGVIGVELVFTPSPTIIARTATGASAYLARTYRLQLAPATDLAMAVDVLRYNDAVEYAEPDYIAHAALVPNDPEWGNQWAPNQINAPAAWDIAQGTNTTVIALIDSGIDLTHPDLLGRLWQNDDIPGNGVDDDQNGKIDDVNGWNFVEESNNLAATNEHGTQVAGVAGAASNNGLGVAGLCWQCPIMPVVAMQANGVANYSTIANAVAYAAANGASVINLSLGGYADSSLLRDTIGDAATSAVIVAAVGNDDDATPFYPAAYADVIAVAATATTDQKTIFSNYGPWVDIAAPGAEILTTTPGGYASPSGTSVAAPFVAGVAGLLKSLHPDWSPTLIAWQILNTATSIDALNPTYTGQLGHGRLDAGAALAQPPQARVQVESYTVDGQSSGRPAPGQSFPLVLALRNTWMPGQNLNGVLTSTDPYVTISDNQGAFGDIEPGQMGQNSSDPFGITLLADTPYNRTLTFSLNLTGANGYATSIPFTLQVRTAVETLGNTQYTQNTIWTSDKTYVLNGTVIVGAGITLTIQPGTVIKGNPGKFMRVDGTLIAQGTAEQPIVFTTNSSNNATWSGIRFTDSAVDAQFDANGNYISGSVLRFINLSYTDTGVSTGTRAPYIGDSIFENNGAAIATGGLGIQDNGGSPHIERNSFLLSSKNIQVGPGIYHAAVTINGGAPLVSQNIFANGGNGIAGLGAPAIIDNRFTNNIGTAIHLMCCSGISSSIIRNNVIVDNSTAIYVSGFQDIEVEHNLIANNFGDCTPQPCESTKAAVEIGVFGQHLNTGVRSNTIINNISNGVRLYVYYQGGSIDIAQNNFFDNGQYDLDLSVGSPGTQNFTLNATNNFWNVDTSAIAGRIHDCTFDENGCGSSSSILGKIQYDPALTEPSQSAPAFVRRAIMDPDPVGLNQIGIITVDFSRPMITDTMPLVSFHDARRGTQETVSNVRNVLKQDAVGRVWFSVNTGAIVYDGRKWYTYTVQSGLGDQNIADIYGAANGDVWFAHNNSTTGVLLSRLRGNQWITYTQVVSRSTSMHTIAQDTNGLMWFGSENGAFSFDGNIWKQYTTVDGLSANRVKQIIADKDGRLWFATGAGAAESDPGGLDVFDGVSWRTYNRATGMPANAFGKLFSDSQGRIWTIIGIQQNPQYHIAMFDGTAWRFFGPNNTGGLLSCGISDFAETLDGTIWITGCNNIITYQDGIWATLINGLSGQSAVLFDNRGNFWSRSSNNLQVRWGGLDYPFDAGQWLSPTRYQSTYNFTALIPQGLYAVDVSGAIGTDDIEATANTADTFRVDFGLAANPAPPFAPAVAAENDGTLTNISASWHTDSLDIDQYRYAIGTTSGARNVVGWTYLTTNSMARNDLVLIQGQQYYVSVQARNKFGLWSTTGVSNQVIGGVSTTLPTPTATQTPTGIMSTPTPTTIASTPTPTPTATMTPGGPALTLSGPDTGAPGSRFVMVGSGFPANTQQPVYLTSQNGVVIASVDKLITTILTDANGNFTLTTSTLASMAPSIYTISVGDFPRLSVQLTLDPTAPLLLPAVSGVPIDLPVTIEADYFLFLPVVAR